MTVFFYADPYVAHAYNVMDITDLEWTAYEALGWTLTPPPDYTVGSMFDESELASDPDLTNWERKMPNMAITSGAYPGKRTLAKNFIKKTLIKRGVDPSTIVNTGELRDAATFKELELIFRDLSDKSDSPAGDKARHYSALFDSEMDLIILTLLTASGFTEVSPMITSIPLYRT